MWLPLPIVGVGLLMASHLLTLPEPELKGLTLEGTGWRALHVIALKCGCSRQVLTHLLERGPAEQWTERIVLIGEDPVVESRARAAGFGFESVTAATLEQRYGVQGAPLLVLVDAKGEARYAGGYARTANAAPEDLALFREVAATGHAEKRPLFGCAVSRSLQKKLDPLSLKYSFERP